MSKCHIVGNLMHWLIIILQEKDLVHKLFKVLAPRYSKYTTSFSRIYKLPRTYPGLGMDRSILELKGNFFLITLINIKKVSEYDQEMPQSHTTDS